MVDRPQELVQPYDRETKLPLWARQELARLRANVKHYQDQLAAGMGNSGAVEVDSAGALLRGREWRLPDDTAITFHLPSPVAGFRHYVTAGIRGDVLHVHGSGPLLLELSASNVLNARVLR